MRPIKRLEISPGKPTKSFGEKIHGKKKTFFKELYIVDCNQIFKGIFLFQMQKDIGSLPDVKSSGH